MGICVIAANNGAGLSRDLHLIVRTLSAAGYEVTTRSLGRGKLRKWLRPWLVRAGNLGRRLRRLPRPYRINLMLEHIRPEYLDQADCNVLIPNPEYLSDKDLGLLPKIQLVLAKTRHAEVIFRDLGCATSFTGFTSEDRWLPGVERRRAFFHLAGRSGAKGTQAILEAWRAHPEWPPLTVVQSARRAQACAPVANIDHVTGYMDDDELRRLQNAHRFHLCPSETEGFGHYLVEALSTGAVTLTTDGEPMNELVTAQHGLLIPVERMARRGAARTWLVQAREIECAVQQALALEEGDCDLLGAHARNFFGESDQSFRARLVATVHGLEQELAAAALSAAPPASAAWRRRAA